ncbi:MAG: EamA family transporter [Candidatus Hodarchaeales archaeon]
MPFDFESFIAVIALMTLYGLIGGSSAVLTKKGILKIGGLEVEHSWEKFLKTFIQLLSNPLWLGGAILGVIGFGVYLVTLQEFELSIVKPLVNTNLLFTFVFASLFLKEKLTLKEWFGVSCLVMGMIFIGFFTSESTGTIEVLPLITLFPLTLLGIIILGFFIFVGKVQNPEILYAISAGFFYGLGAIFTKAILISLTLDFPLLLFSGVMFILTYVIAIVSQQFAFDNGRVSIASPITNAISIIIPVVGAFLIFNEQLIFLIDGQFNVLYSLGKIYGLISILLSIFLLRRAILGAEGGYSPRIPKKNKTH